MYCLSPLDVLRLGLSGSGANSTRGKFDFDVVGRYLTYEYLPRTEANLALTDIRAQHPGATER